MSPIETAFKVFTDRNGKPLENGYIYFGVANLNPITSPITVYWDAAGTQPAAQPLRTVNGYIMRSGTPANVFVGSSYSQLVLDSKKRQVFYARNSDDFSVISGLLALASSIGTSLIGFIAAGVGAVARPLQERLREEVRVTDYMTAAQKADVLARTALVDTSPAWTLAVNRLLAIRGKRIIAPGGIYLLNGGAASGDGYKNGILLPDTNGDFTTGNGITIVGDGVETVFKAGSPNMIVLRHSRLYSGGENFKIDGGGLGNVWGRGIVPEDMTQVAELVSQSYATYKNVTIENCVEGTVFMPGPTVLGADSGCFYHNFYGEINNNNVRDIWMKKDVTGAGNRTTRSSWYGPVFTRGNTGVWIDGGTELDFYSPNFELINTGVTPSASPTAFNYNDSNPANIRLFGGYAEACTVAVKSINPQQVMLIGFLHTSIKDASEFSMGRFTTGRLTVPKTTNVAGYINVGGEGFAGLVVDPNQDGSKTIDVMTNSVSRTRWDVSGNRTHLGTTATIVDNGAGTSTTYSFTGSYIESHGVGGSHYRRAALHGWQTQAGGDIATMSSIEFIPRVDNATSFGISGLRWSAIWAANGTIQTSDPRTKMDIQDSPLGLDFINLLKPKAYRFKMGSNKIVGVREVVPAVMGEIVPAVFEEIPAVYDDGGVMIEPAKTVEVEPAVIGEIEPAKMESVVEAVPGKRLHYGLLTTDVKAAMDKCKVEDFGGWVKTDMADPDSEEGLRYESFVAPMIKAIQELSAKVDALQGAAK